MDDTNDTMSKSETINKLTNDLNGLLVRLVDKTIEYATENESCQDGTINFLSAVIGNLRSRSWIESFFSQEYEMRVSFTINGGNVNSFEDQFSPEDMEQFIQTYFEYGNHTVDVSYVNVYKA